MNYDTLTELLELFADRGLPKSGPIESNDFHPKGGIYRNWPCPPKCRSCGPKQSNHWVQNAKPFAITLLPDVERVVFDAPFTRVYFTDGTLSEVKTSEKDSYNKEVGVIYALLKRVMGKVDDSTLKMDSNGYMCKINRWVENGIDKKEAKAKKAKLRAEAKERAKNKGNSDPSAPKAKKDVKPSLRACVTKLYDLLEKRTRTEGL